MKPLITKVLPKSVNMAAKPKQSSSLWLMVYASDVELDYDFRPLSWDTLRRVGKAYYSAGVVRLCLAMFTKAHPIVNVDCDIPESGDIIDGMLFLE